MKTTGAANNKKAKHKLRFYVIRIGFEPMTYCLEGSCSIQLSYRTNVLRGGKIKEKTGYRQKESPAEAGLFLIMPSQAS
jgi:hypothetical protein